MIPPDIRLPLYSYTTLSKLPKNLYLKRGFAGKDLFSFPSLTELRLLRLEADK